MAGKTTKAEQPSHTPMAYLVDLTRFDGSMTQMCTRPFEAWLRWQAADASPKRAIRARIACK